MRRKMLPGAFFLLCSFVFASFYLSLFRFVGRTSISPAASLPQALHHPLHSILERRPTHRSRRASPPFSILFPDWEVVLLLPAPPPLATAHYCHFQDGSVAPARPVALIRGAAANSTFKCRMPSSVRRLRLFLSPLLASHRSKPPESTIAIEMSRWNFLAYEALSTPGDVILFVKGVNSRQGRNVPETALRCVFSNGATTAVTSSSQEVFRCPHPQSAARGGGTIKVSLEVSAAGRPPRVVPTAAYYTPPPVKSPTEAAKTLLCACTMVRDAAKFLREWVTYHAGIGVGRFVLYDNASEDDVAAAVEKLLEDGYHVTRVLWGWEKAQEAGFSHCAVSYKDACAWMMFTDVDEFVFSPAWSNATAPSKAMLTSLLPSSGPPLAAAPLPADFSASKLLMSRLVGQLSIPCHEFGPSNQASHPKRGVTQGYTCRRASAARHKSVVLLDAVNDNLLNVVHHFQLKEDYRSRKAPATEAVVNHYKYQAWPEFKKKFRRRVSAYVADWRSSVNPTSQDRTPGLGFAPVEPKGWRKKFCEVNDSQLMELGRRWFGLEEAAGSRRLPWEEE